VAGVSPTTVSQALNNVAGARIAEPTRARIREIANELGYTPSRMARGLRLQRSNTIGLISDHIATTPYAGKIILGAQQAARERGWWLLLLSTEGDPDVEAHAAKQLLLHDVEGVLYATMYHRLVDLPNVLSSTATVLIDAEGADRTVPAVVPDEVGGGRAATHALVTAGHTRIGLATNIDDIPATHGRLKGYRAALAAGGIRYDSRQVVAAASTTAGGYAAAFELLDRPDRPTALFCFNDRMAMGAYRAATELGLSIPRDVSIVGFDDQEIISEGLSPMLTTVALPHFEMGLWAVDRLITLIEAPASQSHRHRSHLMPCPLIERASVAAPRAT